MVSASHGLSSRPFAAPAQPHRPPRPAARAQARLAHLSRGWHRRRAPRCHRQRTRAAEAPLAGACGETASVSARLPAAARRTGRPSSRAAPSEPSGRPHRSVGGSSVTTAGLLPSARRRLAGRAARRRRAPRADGAPSVRSLRIRLCASYCLERTLVLPSTRLTSWVYRPSPVSLNTSGGVARERRGSSFTLFPSFSRRACETTQTPRVTADTRDKLVTHADGHVRGTHTHISHRKARE